MHSLVSSQTRKGLRSYSTIFRWYGFGTLLSTLTFCALVYSDVVNDLQHSIGPRSTITFMLVYATIAGAFAASCVIAAPLLLPLMIGWISLTTRFPRLQDSLLYRVTALSLLATLAFAVILVATTLVRRSFGGMEESMLASLGRTNAFDYLRLDLIFLAFVLLPQLVLPKAWLSGKRPADVTFGEAS